MKYENPLPDGLVEPDAGAAHLMALEILVRNLLVEWPDDRLKAEAESLASRRVGGPGSYVAEGDVIHRRGAEVASEIVWDIWDAKQAADERQMMKDGTHPLAGPPEPAD